MRIRAVGDSITFGQHLPFGVPAWPERIGATGRGVCGETTRQALERFPRDVQDDPADITVLQWAHNDCNRWDSDRGLPRVSLEAFRANLVEMIHRCRTFGTTPALVTPTPTRTTAAYDEDLIEYSCAVASVGTHWGVHVIDVREAFYGSGRLSELLMSDGLHLSSEGHQVYANVVENALVRAQVAA